MSFHHPPPFDVHLPDHPGSASVLWLSTFTCYFASSMSAEYCGQCVCLYVLSNISKTTRPSIFQLFCTCHLSLWLSPRLVMMQYVMYFRFVDDVLLWHNGENGPKLMTMHMFHLMCQEAAPIRRQTTLIGTDCQVAALGAKSAISDCI